MASIGICDVVTASVNSEKTQLKKLMMMKMIIISISIMNKSQQTTVFHWSQKLTSAMKERPENKVMVDFKFDAIQLSLHKELPEIGLVKKLTGSLYWWVEQCMPTLHRECYRTL